MSRLANLREERAVLADQAKAINDKYPTGQRMPAAEMEELDGMLNRIEAVDAQIKQEFLRGQEAAREDDAKRGAEGFGDKLRILGPKDKVSSLPRNSMEREPRFGFGEFVRAMVLGTQDDGIRASLSEGTDSAGGYTVPQRLLTQLIDTMRNQTTVVQAGASTLMLDTQKTSIARLATDPTAAWRLENAAIAESEPTFDSVTFNARSLAVIVKISRELLEDSANINQALMQAFAGSMAVEVDRVALFGSGGAPEPRGLYNTPGISVATMGVGNGLPLSPNWVKPLDLMLELKQNNAPDPTAMIMAPRVWRTFAGFTDNTGQPLRAPVAIESLPRLVSKSVPINLTEGTSTNATAILMGHFPDMILGIRSELRVDILREAFAANHQYGFVAHLRMDVQLARPKAFAVLKGILP